MEIKTYMSTNLRMRLKFGRFKCLDSLPLLCFNCQYLLIQRVFDSVFDPDLLILLLVGHTPLLKPSTLGMDVAS